MSQRGAAHLGTWSRVTSSKALRGAFVIVILCQGNGGERVKNLKKKEEKKGVWGGEMSSRGV
jgi:hypothetical protein